MTIGSYARVAALAGAAAALIAGALALWLSAAASSGAASADQVQGTTVEVVDKTISWGSAGDCVQSMGAADFGSVLAGGFGGSTPFNGCVTSNTTPWSVSAIATDLALSGGGSSIPSGNLALRTPAGLPPTGSAAGAGVHCDSFVACPLDTPRTVLSGGSAGTGGFGYDYLLSVPVNAPAGVYNGTVTFTASN
jgi:hypothetical protein